MKKTRKGLIGVTVVVALIVVGGLAYSHYNLKNQVASLFNIQVSPQSTQNSQYQHQSGCNLTIQALPSPVSQTVPAGTHGFDFAHIKFSAPANCSITLQTVRVGVLYASPQLIHTFLANTKVFNLNTNQQVGATVAQILLPNNYAGGYGYYNVSPNAIIPPGGSVTLSFRSDVTGNAGEGVQFGITDTVAVKTGTTIQVGNDNSYWGQVMLTSDVASLGKILLMGGDTGGSASMYPSQWTNDVWSSGDGATWTNVHQNQPGASNFWDTRSNFGLVLLNGSMYLLGGNSDTGGNIQFYSDVWKSADGINWSRIQSNAPWGKRYEMGAVVYNNKIWVIDGVAPVGTNSVSLPTDVWSSSDGIAWTRVTNSTPWGGREEFKALSFNGKMWVLAGFAGNAVNPSITNDVWSSVDGVTWTQVSNIPWHARAHEAATVFNNKMWVLGGDSVGTNNNTAINDVWSSSDGTNWVEQTPSAGWSKRWGHEAFAFANKLWVALGGAWSACSQVGVTACPDLWSSADGVTWTQVLNPTPFPGRDGFRVAVFPPVLN